MAYTDSKSGTCEGRRKMGSRIIYQLKIGLYVFVVLMVGTLFAVRVHNAWQKTNYAREVIFRDGDIEISLHYPAKILSPKIDTNYPLTLSFYYTGDSTSLHTYEISLQSPTLLFVDAKGVEITPHFQFTSSQTVYEQSVYVRPYLSESYPNRHTIDIQTFVDGQGAQTQSAPIEIQTEPRWLSFFSLAAVSLVEISVATALITWIINAIDATSTARKERVAKIREVLNSLSALSYLEQMDKVRKLEEEAYTEHLDDDIGDEIRGFKERLKEDEFFRIVGETLRQDTQPSFSEIEKHHNYFFSSKQHIIPLMVLGRILDQSISPKNVLSDLETFLQLWDDFDVDAKDLIVGALKRLDQKIRLSDIPQDELLKRIFYTSNRRRLLRNVEIKNLFPQLASLSPVGYDAKWLHLPNFPLNPKVRDWLRQHNLATNPFGIGDFKSYPSYPEGAVHPDQWEDVLTHLPQLAQCPTSEDARGLTFLLRSECLPMKTVDAQGNEAATPGKQTFPVRILRGQTVPLELPLITLARSAARTWMEILPFSPDAILDLAPANQTALLELLCWVFGSNNVVINLLKRDNLKDDNVSARLLIKKIKEFKGEFSSAHLPQDAILTSWLKIRPPDLNFTYLIISFDEIPTAAKVWWLEQFSPLVSTLFLQGIVTKILSSSLAPVGLPLSTIQLHWSKDKIKTSLNSQFEQAMDKTAQEKMGQVVDFRSLFGFDSSIGYFESEEDTIEALVAASYPSLARMQTLGNRLLETHCAQEMPTPHLSTAELQTILNSA